MRLPTSGSSAYNTNFFQTIYEIEQKHFWYRLRKDIIAAVLAANFPPSDAPHRYLEIGCGTGNILDSAMCSLPETTVVGSDVSMDAIRIAHGKFDCSLVLADAAHLCFNPVFNAVGLYDVLEHMPDDTAILRSVYSSVIRGGIIIITVPAYSWLWSYADKAAMHKRRYSRRELSAKLKSAGFEPGIISNFAFTALPLIVCKRLLDRGDMADEVAFEKMLGEFKIPLFINNILYYASAWESYWLKMGMTLPLGSSMFAVGHKP